MAYAGSAKDQDSRRGAPFFSARLGAYVVTGYEDIVTALEKPGTFSSAAAYRSWVDNAGLCSEARETVEGVLPTSTPHLVAADPPEHRRLRGPANGAFSARAMTRFAPEVKRLVDELIDGLDADRFDIVTGFTSELPIRTVLTFIGVPNRDLSRVRAWYEAWLRLTMTQNSPDRQVELSRDVVALQSHLQGLVAARQWEPAGDFTGTLVSLAGGRTGRLSENEIVNSLCQLIGAGTETTSFALNECVYRTLRIPGLWRALASDEQLISALVEEALRCTAAFRGLIRVTRSEAVLGGTPIPAGAHLYLHIPSGNRDPDFFSRPDRFEPERSDVRRNIAFGRGPHHCLGAPLARLELRLALSQLSRRMPDLELAPDGAPSFRKSEAGETLANLEVVRQGRGA